MASPIPNKVWGSRPAEVLSAASSPGVTGGRGIDPGVLTLTLTLGPMNSLDETGVSVVTELDGDCWLGGGTLTEEWGVRSWSSSSSSSSQAAVGRPCTAAKGVWGDGRGQDGPSSSSCYHTPVQPAIQYVHKSFGSDQDFCSLLQLCCNNSKWYTASKIDNKTC